MTLHSFGLLLAAAYWSAGIVLVFAALHRAWHDGVQLAKREGIRALAASVVPFVGRRALQLLVAVGAFCGVLMCLGFVYLYFCSGA